MVLPASAKSELPSKISAQIILAALAFASVAITPSLARAANCIVDHDQLTRALKESVKPSGGPSNGGFDNNEWAVLIARDGTVCAVAYSGNTVADQWPASRGIAAAKADTANGVSGAKFAMSTANLYAQVQPGAPLFGVGAANPIDAGLLYSGDAAIWGTANDPLVGKRVGGSIAFGGGLALYDASGIVGAIGVSGDTSCADHNIAWRVREKLGLNRVPGGVSPKHNDAIIYDIGTDGKSASGFGHPTCGGKEVDVAKEIGAGTAPGQTR
jgi:uncharacterized protein GlcG (DUF336 family)